MTEQAYSNCLYCGARIRVVLWHGSLIHCDLAHKRKHYCEPQSHLTTHTRDVQVFGRKERTSVPSAWTDQKLKLARLKKAVAESRARRLSP